MLFHIKPAHVSEEKAAGGIVRVSVQLRVLVMYAVIARPVVDGPLIRHRVDEHQQNTHRPVRVVRSVGPQAVNSAGDTEAAVYLYQGKSGVVVVGRRGRSRGGMGYIRVSMEGLSALNTTYTHSNIPSRYKWRRAGRRQT